MQCNAPNCGNASSHTSQEITYHMFPTESSLRAAWLDALHMRGWEPEECSSVCSDHFQREDLVSGNGRHTLRAGAVPIAVRVTLELNQPINEVHRAFDSNEDLDTVLYSLLEEIAEDYMNTDNSTMLDLAAINAEFTSSDKLSYTSNLLEEVTDDSIENYDVMEEDFSDIPDTTDDGTGCLLEDVGEDDFRTPSDIVTNQDVCDALSDAKFRCISNWPDDTGQSGKTENCNAIGQGIVEFEDISSVGMEYLSSWNANVIESHIRTQTDIVTHQDVFNAEDTCCKFKCTRLQEDIDENTKTENCNALNQDNIKFVNTSSVSMVCISAVHENIAQDNIRTLNDIVTNREIFNSQDTSGVKFKCISDIPDDTADNGKTENCNTMNEDVVQFEDTSCISMMDISSFLEDIVGTDISTENDILTNESFFDVEDTCNTSFNCIPSLQEDITTNGQAENSDELNQEVVEFENTTSVSALCTSSLNGGSIMENEIRTQSNVVPNQEFYDAQDTSHDNFNCISNLPEDTENGKTENCNAMGQEIIQLNDTSNFSMAYISRLDENVLGNDIRSQNDNVTNQEMFNAQDTINAQFECMSNFPESIAEIGKPENCNAISQNVEFEDTSSVSMVYISSFNESIVNKNIRTLNDIVHQDIFNADDTCNTTNFKCNTTNLLEDTTQNSKAENYDALTQDDLNFGNISSIVCVSGLDGNIVGDDVRIGNDDVIYDDSVKVDHTHHNHTEHDNAAGEVPSSDNTVHSAEARRNTELNGIQKVTSASDPHRDSETDGCLVNTTREVRPPKDLEPSLNQIEDDESIQTCSLSDCSIEYFRSLSKDGPLLCEICNKSFTKVSNLRKHILVHSALKPFVCDICHKSFIQKSILKSHIGTHYELKPYACHICDKRYNYKSSFAIHMKRHSSETPFSCGICKKTFNRKTILDTHMRTHSGEKPFSCRMCDKTFSQKPHLSAHMRTHSGEKPFSCDVCYKAFNRKSHLNRHVKLHSSDKPFSCKICFKDYGDATKLAAHVRTHEKRPYSCGSCYKVFDSRPNLNRHLRRYI